MWGPGSSGRPPQPPCDLELRETFARFGVVTACERMFPVLRQAWKAARASDATLLIEGETGTGKQVFAESIHHLDPKRSPYHFITVHCATIQENLAESEFFGHQKGSFSGATSERKGLFRAADRGTLFLDDVNDLPAPIQTRQLEHAVRRMLLEKESGHSLDLADWLAQDTRGSNDPESGDAAEQAAILLWQAIKSGRITYSAAFESLERRLLQAALGETTRKRKQIAADLGMSERTLYQKLSGYGLAGKAVQRSAETSRRTADFCSDHKAKIA